MMKDVVDGDLRGGVFLVPTAPAAMVLANKFRGIRAVQGNGPDGVAEGIAQLDANVLVVEHARRSFYEIRNVIDTFATLPRSGAPDAALAEAIATLEGRP